MDVLSSVQNLRVGVLVIAAVSLLGIGYVLLAKSSDILSSNRRR